MIKYWYEMNDNECSIFCEFGDYSSDGQVCYGINREKLATITKEAFIAMFEKWVTNPTVEQYCSSHDKAVNNLSRKETIRIMDFFLHKQCSLGRMKNTPYDDENLVWEAVNKVFEEWKQLTKCEDEE